MALIHSKQLNPKLTGSFTISGSNALDTIGGIVNTGGITSDTLNVNHVTASGNITAVGNVSSSGNLSVTQNVDVDGTSNFAGNMTLQNNLITLGNVSSSGNLFVTQNVDVDGTSNFQGDVVLQNNLSLSGHITASGNISASGIVYASRFESAGASNEVISFNDNLNITGHITASGDISGSSTSTGSFGKIELNDGTHLNAGKFSISGSSTSTASFGVVKVHAIEGASPITFNDTIIENQNLIVQGFISGSGDIRTSGNVIASRFVSSGSNSMQFGVTSTDKHEFTGSVAVTGSLNVESGRVFEQGTSVIDHATAMAIVFGG